MSGKPDKGQLAYNIASILDHPDTPKILYDSIAEALTEMSSHIDYHTQDMIERTLEAYEKSGERKQT